MSEEKQKPAKQFRDGAIGVSVWKRSHNGEIFFNATPSRAYLDEKDTSGGAEGTWKYSDSFSRSDLPVLASLLTLAHFWIVNETAKAA